jgi:hypothetical protein
MNKQDLNKLTMMKALRSFMQNNQAKWQTINPIAQAYSQLHNLIEQVDATLLSVNDPNAGELEQKKNLQLSLIDEGFEIVSYIYAFAGATNNTVLKGKVDFPVSLLRNLRDGELSNKLRAVLELMAGHEAELEQYGATQQKADIVRNLINRYEQQLPKTRNNLSEQKSGNEMIKQTLKTAITLVTEQLDKLMIRFKKEDPSFYTAYKANRKIVDYGKRYEKPAETEEKQVEPVK